jgi:hypothetical protein
MVSRTWYRSHFEVHGDKSVHHGLFDCAPAPASEAGCAPGACC